MNHLKIGFLLLSLFLVSNCEKPKNMENMTTDAEITGFVTEKCYCCWGWVIKVDSEIIKADSLPGLTPGENITFPFTARITTGKRTRECSRYNQGTGTLPDYYEIKSFSIK